MNVLITFSLLIAYYGFSEKCHNNVATWETLIVTLLLNLSESHTSLHKNEEGFL